MAEAGGFEIEEATIAGIQEAISAGQVSVTELVDEYLARIERIDRSGPELNAIVATSEVARDRAAEQDAAFAESGELSGPLHGVVAVVKDNIFTDDMPATCGSETMAGYRPKADATAVKRMRDAGAIILAKSTLPDWATSWFSYSSVSGSTRMPYDPGTDPGGSSAGSGAAVAANLATAGLGTDCGGSIRLPAANCNLVGVRGTPGFVPRTGSSYLVLPQDTVGPLARTVTDAALITDVIAGYDPGDPYSVASRAASGPPLLATALDAEALRGARLGLVTNALGSDSEQMRAVSDLIRAAAADLEAAGAIVVEVEIPDLMDHIVATSSYEDRSRHDLDLFLDQLGDTPISSMAEVYETKRFPPECDLIEAMANGFDDPGEEPEYLKRFLARHEFELAITNVMARDDLRALILPTAQVPAQTMEGRKDWTTLTYPTNTVIASQSWLPALSVPAGFTPDGLPVGLEILGRQHDEAQVFALAYGYEQATHHRRAPEL